MKTERPKAKCKSTLRLLTLTVVCIFSHLALAVPHSLVGANGGYIRNEHKPRVIVFVHGLFSSPETWRCDEQHFWPQMIAQDKDPAFADSDVYVVSYPTPTKHGKMKISDLETLIESRLEADHVFSEHREVVFVSHSLGGILTQQLLLTYRDKDLYRKVSFIYLFGTPQEGSKLANFGKVFISDPLLKELTAGEGNFILPAMDEQWLHSGFTSIQRFCAYETQPEHGFKVVDRNSATRGCQDNTAIPANHSTIVKPCDSRNDSYIALKNKLQSVKLDEAESIRHQPIVSAPEGIAIGGGVVDHPTVNVYHGLDLRESISIEPSVSLDTKEAFQQQFTVTNNGPLAIAGVQFACAVTSIQMAKGHTTPLATLFRQNTAFFMVPVMGQLRALGSREKTNIDCDYLARDGTSLESTTIEIEVAFTVDPTAGPTHKRQSFTGRRDAAGDFIWTYGSPFPSLLEPAPSELPKRTVLVMPFGGGNRALAPDPSGEEMFSAVMVWAGMLKRAGCTVIVSTMISGK